MTIRHPVLRVALLALVIGLLAAACVRESDENANEGVDASGGGVVVEVRITDDEIALPDEIPAGPAVFEVTNNGTVTHGFAIEGVDDQLELRLDELDTLTVSLEQGTYVAYSPVADDREGGLETEFTVVEATEEDNRDPADAGVGPSDVQDEIEDEGP